MPKRHQVDFAVYRNDSNLIFSGVLNHSHWGRANTEHSQIVAKKIIFSFEQKKPVRLRKSLHLRAIPSALYLRYL